MKKILIIALLTIGFKSNACNVYDTINKVICPEDSFLFNGVYLKSAGTYYDTFNISLGCDTFRTLNLSVHATIPPTTIIDSFCPGYPYTYNSKSYSIPNIYYDTLSSVNGCDSIITLALTYKYSPTIVYPTIDSFCIRDTIYYVGKKFKYNSGGTKTIRDTAYGGAANGCDSINIRFVFIRNNNSSGGFFVTRFACRPYRIVQKDIFDPTKNHLDTTFTTNSTFFNPKVVIFQNRYGCDSTVTFSLQLRDTSTTTLYRTTCSNQPFFFNGEWLGAGVTQPTTIYKRDTFTQTVNGPGGNTARCDSFINLELTVYPVKFTVIDTVLCENNFYFFKGQNRNTPGTYRDTLATSNGCDSFVTLNLTLRKTSRYTYYRKFCSNETVFFNDVFLNQPGIYNDTLVNAVGCDSFLTMVLSKDTAHYITLNKSICSYDSFYFGGKYLDTAGTYMATFRNKDGCDSMVTLNLNVYPFRTVTLVRSTLNNIKTDSGYVAYYWYFNDWKQLNASGYILAANTTGSYYVIAEDANNCKFKSNVYVHNPAGVIGNNANDIRVFPIPSSHLLNIESNSTFDKNTTIYLYSMEGKLVLEQKIIGKSSKFSIDLSSVMKGLYILKIESENQSIERRIEKQ
jgi:hypothetical protein